ncbi:MAG: hypothetical protein E2P00_02945 [Acidobacteria bacterium]|nr:MAG: hypothetical protein E2P00_02945 [Acidobacteriota bacterium]
MSPPRRARILLLAAGLTLALLPAGLPAAASKADVDLVGEQLVCYCGCSGLTVKACTCGTADAIREKIAGQLDSGLSTADTVAIWVDERGEQILAVPTREGFNLVGWFMPFVVTLLGLLMATVVVLRWQKQATEAAATPRGTGTEDPDSAYLKRVEQGMKNLHR